MVTDRVEEAVGVGDDAGDAIVITWFNPPPASMGSFSMRLWSTSV